MELLNRSSSINSCDSMEEFCNNYMNNFEMSKSDVQNKRGLSPLHVAASQGNEELVRTLLQNGYSPVSLDKIGNTPLHYCGHKEIAACLLEWGADTSTRNKRGDLPIDLMKRRGVESQLITFMSDAMKDIVQYAVTTEEISQPLLPQTLSKPSRRIIQVKSLCLEFCSDLGIKRLIVVLFVVLVLSLYFAFLITGIMKHEDIKVVHQGDKLEL